jgi:hypothetical protein
MSVLFLVVTGGLYMKIYMKIEAAGMVLLLDVREDGVGGSQVVLHPVGGPGEGGQEGGEGDGPGPGRRAEQGQSQERQLPVHKQRRQSPHA